jgi:alpha-N-arabinofuranosidase
MKSIPLQLMGGLSIHCYVKPGEESSGTVFSDDSWYQTAVNTYAKEPLFRRNISIMDYYDPEKKVAMAVDEWGIWVDNEPGTAPGFLFQQNTMRSALCAVLMLHLFHRYADRIRIANLAQTINVLQAIILTKDDKMVLTPTYHVFDLLKGHQGGHFLSLAWDQAPDTIRKGLPQADLSASMKEGCLTLSLINLSTEKDADLSLTIDGAIPSSASGRLLSGRPTDHNSFEDPKRVAIRELENLDLHGQKLRLCLPPCAIASVEVVLA